MTSPSKGKRATRGKRKPERVEGFSVDARGRWRDERGRFVRGAVVMEFHGGTLDDAAFALEEAARNPRTGKARGKYLVSAQFIDDQIGDEGWRMLSRSKGLRTALRQAANWLRQGIETRGRGLYGRDPLIADIEIVPWTVLYKRLQSERAKEKKRLARKAKRRKGRKRQ